MTVAQRSFCLWVLLPGALIPIAVGLLFAFPQQLALGGWVRGLPAIHASVNGTTAVLLLAALWAIKGGHVRLHRRLMGVCIAMGVLFLLSYVLYHSSVPSTKYGDSNGDGLLSVAEKAAVGQWRTAYLLLLASHIVFSMSVVYLVLMALHHARLGRFKRHKAVVRYAFPIWWYVSVSGVLVYFMIAPFYP